MVLSEVSNMLGYKQLDSQKDLFEFELNSKKVKRTIVGFSLLTFLPVLFLVWWVTNFLAAPTYPLHFILIFIIVSVIALGVLVHFFNQIKEGIIELKRGRLIFEEDKISFPYGENINVSEIKDVVYSLQLERKNLWNRKLYPREIYVFVGEGNKILNIIIVDKFNCQSKDIDIAIDLMYQGKFSNYIEMDLKFNNGFKPRKSFLTIF